MTQEPSRVRRILEKLPLKFLAPFFYVIFVSSILLYLALSPFIYLYGLLRCCEVWIEWRKQGKDVLLISMDGDYAREWMSRLEPLLVDRAFILNWSERKNWDRSSLPAQLYGVFGPHGMPEQFTAHSLPAVILFRFFHRPTTFTFGHPKKGYAKDNEEKLEQLRAELCSR